MEKRTRKPQVSAITRVNHVSLRCQCEHQEEIAQERNQSNNNIWPVPMTSGISLVKAASKVESVKEKRRKSDLMTKAHLIKTMGTTTNPIRWLTR